MIQGTLIKSHILVVDFFMVIFKVKVAELLSFVLERIARNSKSNISSWEEEQKDYVKKNISVTYANNMETVLLHVCLKHQFYYLCRLLQ